MKRNPVFILLSVLSLSTLSSCFQNAQMRGVLVIPTETHSHTTTVISRYEPPPFAPANGFRQHYYDRELQYDSGFGAYVVIGSPGLYFYDNHYIRYYDNRWQSTNRLQGVWRPAGNRDVPGKLRERHARQHHAREHREESRHERHEAKHERHEERREAPRHGHRRHYQNHELSYDSRVGAYVIINQPGIYFYNKRYLRWNRGAWQSANKLNGTWRPAKKQYVPNDLMKRRHRNKRENTHEKKKHYDDNHEDRQHKQRNQLQDVWRGN